MGSHTHFPYTGTGATAAAAAALSPFSALHFLRNYNNLLIPQTELNQRYPEIGNTNRLSREIPISCRSPDHLTNETHLPTFALQPASFITSHGLISYPSLTHMYQTERKSSPLLPRTLSVSSFSSSPPRRQRGEKKPIPCEQKDDKYYERRKRNNQAAKKSRDARKIREDQIALRATMLEHENAILRAQLLTLREEAASLRQMLFLKKTAESVVTQELQICPST